MNNKQCRKIGFWHEKGEDDKLPRVSEFINMNFDEETKQKVLKYIDERMEVHSRYKGWSNCRLCKKKNGSDDLTDGEYIIPSGYAHYIEKHFVIPPSRFIRKVLKFYS